MLSYLLVVIILVLNILRLLAASKTNIIPWLRRGELLRAGLKWQNFIFLSLPNQN